MNYSKNLKYFSKIAIHSVPRSGSTWLGTIFDSSPVVNYNYQPLFSYKLKAYINAESDGIRINEFFKLLAENEDEFIKQKEHKDEAIIPIFCKALTFTHVVYKEVRYHNILENILSKNKTIKLILLIRDPRSVISSWYESPKEFRRDLGWKLETEWFSATSKNKNLPHEYYGFEKWVDFTLLAHELKRKYENQVKILKYSNLISNTNGEIEKLFKFCKLEFSTNTIQYISDSKKINNPNTYSTYKVKQNDLAWKNNLPFKIIEKIEKLIIGKNLEDYLT